MVQGSLSVPCGLNKLHTCFPKTFIGFHKGFLLDLLALLYGFLGIRYELDWTFQGLLKNIGGLFRVPCSFFTESLGFHIDSTV